MGLQNTFIEIANNSCLFDSYCYLCGLTDIDKVLYVASESLRRGWLKPDGFVYDPDHIIQFITGKKGRVVVSKKPQGTCIAKYVYNGKNHFVVVEEDGLVIYDPFDNSMTVRNGKIQDYRIIKWQ